MKLTDKELAVLRAIRDSEYNDNRDTSAIWTFSVWDNVDRNVVTSRRSLGGIVGSLIEKGLMKGGWSNHPDATVALTDAGLAAITE